MKHPHLFPIVIRQMADAEPHSFAVFEWLPCVFRSTAVASRRGLWFICFFFWLALVVPGYPQVLETTQVFEGPSPAPEELMQGADGDFYGTTRGGGPFHGGTLFKMNAAGPVYRLASFDGTNGFQPNSPLVQDVDGNFYGTTYTGGSNNLGTVFKMTPAKVLSALHTFSAGNGAHPTGLFLQASNSTFYGVTADGSGTSNAPAIFQLTKTGVFMIVAILDVERQGIATSLSEAPDGNFYGTFLTRAYNSLPPLPTLSRAPIFFRMNTQGVITNLVSFPNAEVFFGRSPVVQGRDGNFYGFYINGYIGTESIFKINRGGTLTILATLNRSTNPIYPPESKMVQGSDGSFYFTTKPSIPTDSGGIMKFSTAGILTNVHLFPTLAGRVDYPEFMNPGSPLVAGKDGYLYGTIGGGNYNNLSLFKMSTVGVMTKQGPISTVGGYAPAGGLVQAADGSFYGAMSSGGLRGGGTVFKITSQGVFSTLASFMDTNGYSPNCRLVFGLDGILYGTTGGGSGTNLGTIFRITPAGILTRVVNFTGTNGISPVGGLVCGNDGNFYGATRRGGAKGAGTIFKLTSAGVLTTLFSFTGINEEHPSSGLIQGKDGNFYGTTAGYTTVGLGSVYKMTPAGVMTTLVALTGSNGLQPSSKIFQASNGMFYGTAFYFEEGKMLTSIFNVTPAGVLTVFAPLESTTISGDGFIEGSDGFLYAQASNSGQSEMIKLNLNGNTVTTTPFVNDEGPFNAGTGLTLASSGELYAAFGAGGAGYAAPQGWWGDFNGGTILKFRIAPLLNLSRNGDQLIHSWSTNITGLVLQSATSLEPGTVWTDSPVLPTKTGSQYKLTNNISISNRFYRLKK